jgi:hypothetical protein
MIQKIPGLTDLTSYKKFEGVLPSLNNTLDKNAIILATNDVNDNSLFMNGLTQNIVILYDMFESLGYKSYLLQYNNDTTSHKREFIKRYDSLTVQDILTTRIPIYAFIEIGMSLDASTRSYLKTIGSKIIKLYLGNIINIDIESIQNYKSIFFMHHVVGEIDQIWTSPHYEQHVEYAAVLNRTEISNSRVVPYVWDPCFISYYENREAIEWHPVSDWRNTDIVIMDANISFQKCYFYSLLLSEAFYKKHREWKGKVHIINGDKIDLTAYSKNVVLPQLTLFKEGRIVLHGRKNIHTILKENRSACFITHQLNNDFNYMMLELMYCNYPVLHNSEGWNMFGYNYNINKWDAAIEVLHNALLYHSTNLNIYKTHTSNLMWKHSIHNPEIQNEWRKILE